MGYRIVYASDPKLDADRKQTGKRLRILTATGLLIFCMLVRLLWPEGADILNRVVLPGEPTVPERAFQTMLSDFRMGEPAEEALATFCKTVIRDASYEAR